MSVYGGRIDGIFFCPHGPEDHCHCRKPQAGLYEEIAQRLDTDLFAVPAVGDSLRDLQAAQVVGASPILVRTGKGERTIAKGEGLDDIPVYTDLAEYVDQLLEGQL